MLNRVYSLKDNNKSENGRKLTLYETIIIVNTFCTIVY